MEYNTKVSVKETNEKGYGFECSVSIDPQLNKMIGFDIAWLHEDEQDVVNELSSVGVLMTSRAARAVADRLNACAYEIEDNKEDRF